jgi:hypothetical protein
MNCQFDTSHIIDIPFESRSTSFDFSLLLLYFFDFLTAGQPGMPGLAGKPVTSHKRVMNQSLVPP